jgi:hypothetical protein
MTARKDPSSKCGSRTWHPPRACKRTPPPPLPPNARVPTAGEQQEMIEALDQMLLDERVLATHGHNPTSPWLYRREIVDVMSAVVDGKPVDPDRMWHVLDMLDQHHRMAEVSDQGVHKFHAERQALISIAQDEAA